MGEYIGADGSHTGLEGAIDLLEGLAGTIITTLHHNETKE